MTPRFRFAPVSSGKSSLLDVACGYFILNGAVYGLLVVAAIVRVALGEEVPAPKPLNLLGLLIGAMIAAGLVWIGILLGHGRRLGGVLALGLIILPIALAAVTRQSVPAVEVIFGVLGVIVLVSVWRELR